MPVKGANYRTLQKWAKRWGIDTAHFDPNAVRRESKSTRAAIPLDQVLVEDSSYNRGDAEAPPLRERAC